MKRWKVAILMLLALSMVNCTVEKQEGLWLDSFVDCTEEDIPQGETPFSVATEGTYDVAVSWYYGANGAYKIRPLIKNVLESSINEEFMTGEGNNIFLRRIEIEFEVPTDWDQFEKVSIPISGALEPETIKMMELNAIPTDLRLKIEENFAKNAYKSAQPFSTLRPPVTNADGSRIACTVENAEEKCQGYPCVVTGDQQAFDPASTGYCANACTIRSGCAGSEFKKEPRLDVNDDPFDYWYVSGSNYACDIGAGDFGFCRQACSAGFNDCEPLLDPQTGETLVEFQCIRGACIPAGTTVNPYDPDPVVLKIRVIGQDAAGNWVGSNTMQFPLTICRGCLLDFDTNWCDCTPLTTAGRLCYDEALSIDENGDVCDRWWRQQDRTIQCAWLSSCYNVLCEH